MAAANSYRAGHHVPAAVVDRQLDVDVAHHVGVVAGGGHIRGNDSVSRRWSQEKISELIK